MKRCPLNFAGWKLVSALIPCSSCNHGRIFFPSYPLNNWGSVQCISLLYFSIIIQGWEFLTGSISRRSRDYIWVHEVSAKHYRTDGNFSENFSFDYSWSGDWKILLFSCYRLRLNSNQMLNLQAIVTIPIIRIYFIWNWLNDLYKQICWKTML